MRELSPQSAPPFIFSEYMKKSEEMHQFLLYSDDGPRLGRARRALSIAGVLTARSDDTSVLLVTGADDVSSLGLPGNVGVLKLPEPRPPDDPSFAVVHQLRQKLLAAATETFRPDVLLVDTHPFGEGGELGPALEIVRAAGGHTVLALTDAVDERAAIDLEWRNRGLFERIADDYDRVLVYGQPDLLDPILDCGFPDDVARMTSFCGYVVSSPRAPASVARSARGGGRLPNVLATAGEGEDGFELLLAFLAAAVDAGWQATVVAGPHRPEAQLEVLRRQAAETGVTFRHFVPSLFSEFSSLDALVCMGGYNTLAEAAAAAVPTVCVPRLAPGRDQLLRARAFAQRGLVRLVEPHLLEPRVLRAEIEAALAARPLARRALLDVGGDRRAAHYLFELAARRATRYPRSLVGQDDLSLARRREVLRRAEAG